LGLWIGAATQGLAYAFLAWAALLSLRVLRFADISVDGTFTTGGAVAALLLLRGQSPLVACSLAIVAGLAGGAITGLIHTKLGINDLLSGILVMTGLYSVNLHVMGRSNMPLLDAKTVVDLADGLGLKLDSTWAPLAVFLALALVFRLLLVALLKTDYGLALRATGDGPAMVPAQSVNTDLVKIVGLALANGMAALSGALIAQYQGFVDIAMGIGSLVTGIAGVVIGERLLGVRGVAWNLTSALVGAIVFRLLIAGALRVGLNPVDLKLATAVLVLVALSLPGLRRRRRAA
jgi:putative ABC transport system permease protein